MGLGPSAFQPSGEPRLPCNLVSAASFHFRAEVRLPDLSPCLDTLAFFDGQQPIIPILYDTCVWTKMKSSTFPYAILRNRNTDSLNWILFGILFPLLFDNHFVAGVAPGANP